MMHLRWRRRRRLYPKIHDRAPDCGTIKAWAAGLVLLAAAVATAADWQPAQGPLMTRWGRQVRPDQVHPEYPRPQMVRPQWVNLNGLWDYAIRPASEPQPSGWDGKLLVPFPIESALSGVRKRVEPTERLWQRRTFHGGRPAGGRRVLLHFGAVDWKCEVLVNGRKVGEHQGGYDPFWIDITDALTPQAGEQEVVVAVTDPTDSHWQPRGKQVLQPRGIWYTPTTGIWQTVWLEEVPASYVERLEITPDLDHGQFRVRVHAAGQPAGGMVRVTAMEGDREAAAGQAPLREGVAEVVLTLADPKPWSCQTPFLYGLKVRLEESGDEVSSYAGLRKISLGKDAKGVTRLFLNNQPLFQYGLLDQGFWPDGLYTAPSDAALRYDLEVTKQLGFNMIRKHVKVEPARWYYHCDQLGLLVWQDMPSGDRYIRRGQEDIQRSPESAANYEREWGEILKDLQPFPSIVMWVPFNEGWGQFETARIAAWTKERDPTRLVNSASGWQDRGVGDVHDVHVYPGPDMPPLEERRAAVLGEFGGLGLPLEGHTWQSKDNWGYRSYTSRQALETAYGQLQERLKELAAKGLSAAVYTQTTDVEIEVNGLLTYDREVLKLDPAKARAWHEAVIQAAADAAAR